MLSIDEKYILEYNRKSDINEHLPTLNKYATLCDSIIELGVREIISTWALLAGRPDKMLSIDLDNPEKHGVNIDEVYEACNDADIEFEFKQADSTTVDLPETDLLFIDTLHEYAQLKAELNAHHTRVKKYILFHDTVSCQHELMPAIIEFLQAHPEWKMREMHYYNNGFAVIERVV